MGEYIRGQRLRDFCEANKLKVSSIFDEFRNVYLFSFESSDEDLYFTFSIELDGTRYIARGEQSEIELVHVAQRKLNQITQK